MKILVATSSRHGSTLEIGEAIAGVLREAGHTVEMRPAKDVDGIDGYDAAVIGSAIYLGSWLPEARDLVGRRSAELKSMPVWLFSSGPIGSVTPPIDRKQLDELMRLSGCREHSMLGGKLDRSHLGFGERMAVRLVKAPEGDFRDWDEVRAWAEEIATALSQSAATVS